VKLHLKVKRFISISIENQDLFLNISRMNYISVKNLTQKKHYVGVHIVIFSRSESGAETRSQTFQCLLDILNKTQVDEQVSTDI
jgi:hypothetical protein